MKRFAALLLALVLCCGIILPQQTSAASTVRVTYNGTTKTYSKKKTYIYVNNKKVKMAAVPVFLKSGAYMGPMAKIFKNSSLKVSVSKSSKKLTLKYGNNTLTMTSGSRKAILNGKERSSKLGAAPMLATYTASGKKRWIVPLNSVCKSLGISYRVSSSGDIYIGGTTNTATTSTTTASKTSTNTSTSTKSNKVVLVLDAGHGGVDSGATGNSLKEKNLTLSIVLAAKKYFDNDSRFKVYYTRTSDTYPSLDDRCTLANKNNADIFISVHINSASASAVGTETLYNSSRNSATTRYGVTSRELATAMQKGAVSATGFPNRGLKNRTDLRVLNKTNMPACLIEYGFISNSKEAVSMKKNTAIYGKKLYDSVVSFMKTKKRIS